MQLSVVPLKNGEIQPKEKEDVEVFLEYDTSSKTQPKEPLSESVLTLEVVIMRCFPEENIYRTGMLNMLH